MRFTARPGCSVWVHKTANVLNAMPKSAQPRAKAHLKDIWMAETKAGANVAFEFFVEACGVKYDRAVKCLTKDRADLLTFGAPPVLASNCPPDSLPRKRGPAQTPGRALETHQDQQPD